MNLLQAVRLDAGPARPRPSRPAPPASRARVGAARDQASARSSTPTGAGGGAGDGSGSRPLQCAQPQNTAVVELRSPDTTPMARGFTDSDATPAAAVESTMVAQIMDSMVEKMRPR